MRFGITDTQWAFHERHENGCDVFNTDISVTRGTEICDLFFFFACLAIRTQRRPDVSLQFFNCFVEWHLQPAMFRLFEEPPVEIGENLGAKISFASAFIWELLMVRFHSLNDSSQPFVAGVVETTFASSQENVVEIGFDDGGKKEGIRRE